MTEPSTTLIPEQPYSVDDWKERLRFRMLIEGDTVLLRRELDESGKGIISNRDLTTHIPPYFFAISRHDLHQAFSGNTEEDDALRVQLTRALKAAIEVELDDIFDIYPRHVVWHGDDHREEVAATLKGHQFEPYEHNAFGRSFMHHGQVKQYRKVLEDIHARPLVFLSKLHQEWTLTSPSPVDAVRSHYSHTLRRLPNYMQVILMNDAPEHRIALSESTLQNITPHYRHLDWDLTYKRKTKYRGVGDDPESPLTAKEVDAIINRASQHEMNLDRSGRSAHNFGGSYSSASNSSCSHRAIRSPAYAAIVIIHEVAHFLDDIIGGRHGWYSDTDSFRQAFDHDVALLDGDHCDIDAAVAERGAPQVWASTAKRLRELLSEHLADENYQQDQEGENKEIEATADQVEDQEGNPKDLTAKKRKEVLAKMLEYSLVFPAPLANSDDLSDIMGIAFPACWKNYQEEFLPPVKQKAEDVWLGKKEPEIHWTKIAANRLGRLMQRTVF